MEKEQEFQFPAHLLKNLADRNSDKRELACREIKDIAQRCIMQNKFTSLIKIINFLQKKLLISGQVNSKAGGMRALTSISSEIGQNRQGSDQVSEEIINIVLKMFQDSADAKVRLMAIQCMKDVFLAMGRSFLAYVQRVFQALIGKICDCDDSVKMAATFFNNQLQGFLTQQLQHVPKSYIAKFIKLVAKNMQAGNPVVKIFLIDWLSLIDQVPNLFIINYISLFLRQLLRLVSDKSQDTKKKAEVLEKGLRNQFAQLFKHGKARFSSMQFQQIIHITVNSASQTSSNSYTVLKALEWINILIQAERVNILNGKKQNQLSLALQPAVPMILEVMIKLLNSDQEHIRQIASKGSQSLIHVLRNNQQASIKQIFPLVKKILSQKQSGQLGKYFGVLTKFLLQRPNQQHEEISIFLKRLIQKVMQGQQNFVQNFLSLNFHFSFHGEIVDNFLRICGDWVNSDKKLDSAGLDPVLAKFSLVIGGQQLFKYISSNLKICKNIKLQTTLLGILTNFLVTSKSLADVRFKLRQKDCDYFKGLFQTWVYSTSSAVVLCLLGQQYSLAYDILLCYQRISISQQIILELYEVVNLLESPNFTYLRLKILNAKQNYFLVKFLRCLQMIIPQGKAYHALRNRLSHAPASQFTQHVPNPLLEAFVNIITL